MSEEYIVLIFSIKVILLDETLLLVGVELGSVIFREEQGLRVFENRVLREVFGTWMVEVTGDWRKFCAVGLKYLFSPNTVKPQFCIPVFCI